MAHCTKCGADFSSLAIEFDFSGDPGDSYQFQRCKVCDGVIAREWADFRRDRCLAACALTEAAGSPEPLRQIIGTLYLLGTSRLPTCTSEIADRLIADGFSPRIRYVCGWVVDWAGCKDVLTDGAYADNLHDALGLAWCIAQDEAEHTSRASPAWVRTRFMDLLHRELASRGAEKEVEQLAEAYISVRFHG